MRLKANLPTILCKLDTNLFGAYPGACPLANALSNIVTSAEKLACIT